MSSCQDWEQKAMVMIYLSSCGPDWFYHAFITRYRVKGKLLFIEEKTNEKQFCGITYCCSLAPTLTQFCRR